ncbi:MAG: hypothetical protein LBI54_06895 [Lachnospiraceae bacterium]|jgi:xylulokinase|nr:hypothetical protein [Lachnospiraceae bacterium]
MMEHDELVCVINLGMTGIRMIVYNHLGNPVHTSYHKLLSSKYTSTRFTQKPGEWVSKMEGLIINCPLSVSKHIKYFTVTGSASCLICCDAAGNALNEAIMVSDARAVAQAARINGLVANDSSLLSSKLETDCSLMLPKILWIKENAPALYEKTYKFLAVNDYLICYLTGVFATDCYNALKCGYDIATGEYPTRLLSLLEIDAEKLPPVAAVGSGVGPVTPEMKSKLMLENDCLVIQTTYDSICSFYGADSGKEGDLFDVSGTVTSLRLLSTETEEKPNIYKAPYLLNANYNIYGGSNNLSGGLVDWLKDVFMSKAENPYLKLEDAACKSEVGARGIVFLPYLMGERFPLWIPDIRGTFWGLGRASSCEDMIRAAFESYGLSLRLMIDELLKNNIRVDKLFLSGGLTQIEEISQIKADVTGLETVVLENYETTAYGAFVLIKRLFFYEAIDESRHYDPKRIKAVFSPNPKNHDKYMAAYETYRNIYKALLPTYNQGKEPASYAQ